MQSDTMRAGVNSNRIDDSERKQRHCQIQNFRAGSSRARVPAEHAVPAAFENKKAKLEPVENRPGELQRIKAEIAAGTHHGRRWGDVKDIGFRELVPGQENDVKDGREAVRRKWKALRW